MHEYLMELLYIDDADLNVKVNVSRDIWKPSHAVLYNIIGYLNEFKLNNIKTLGA